MQTNDASPKNSRDLAISRIRSALRRRTGRAWSVTGGRGTGWGWISISAPPARRNCFDGISLEDADELSRIFGVPANCFRGGAFVVSPEERERFVAMAEEPNLSDLPKMTAANDAA